jgi:hypothetical protein
MRAVAVRTSDKVSFVVTRLLHAVLRLFKHSSMGYLFCSTGACTTLSFAFSFWRPCIGPRNCISEALFGGYFLYFIKNYPF